MDDGVPLPATLSGDVQERLVRLDKSLFFIVAGALEFLTDMQNYEPTGAFTEQEARDAFTQMLWDFYNLEPKLVATGSVIQYAGATIPDGWLACDGTVLVRADYPDLFTAIGVLYNTGGETGLQFRLPDMRGRASIGAGAGAGLTNRALAAAGGTETHTLTGGELPEHTHGVPVASADGTSTVNARSGTLANFIGHVLTASSGAENITGGDNQPHANMQPWLALNWIIAL